MNSVLKNLARPYIFLIEEGSFAILIALFFSVFTYSYFYPPSELTFNATILNFVGTFVSPASLLQRIVLFLIFFSIFYFLFRKTFLKFFNYPFFNVTALILLLIILYQISHEAFFIITGIGLLLVIYNYLFTSGNFFYDISSTPFGDSRWSKFPELEKVQLTDERKFILGRDEANGRIIGFDGEGHVLTVAKTGAGKGVGVVVPNLLHYSGSIVVIDPKGENFIRTVFARENLHQQEICLIDPFGEVFKQVSRQLKRIKRLENEARFQSNVADIKSFYEGLLDKVAPPQIDEDNQKEAGIFNKGFNPLQLIEQLVLDANFQEVFDQANVVANMIVVRTATESDPHWNDKAKMIIKNIIIFTSLHEDFVEIPINLITVKTTISAIFEDEESLETFVSECKESKFSEYFEPIASEFSLISNDERLSVLSTVMRHLEFIDSPLVKNSLSRSDFNLHNLKQTKMTVYLVLPANKLDAYSRLMRLWISSVLNFISLDLEPPVERILMIIDEMAQLGKMEPLVQAVSLLRGYGLNLWMIFQDLSQMKDIYGAELWKTFSSNARFQQFFGISDKDTAEYVSALSGKTTVIKPNQTIDAKSNVTSHSFSPEERQLLQPDNLYRTDLQFIFTDGLFPIKARKIRFYADGEFVPGKHLPFQLRDELKTFF